MRSANVPALPLTDSKRTGLDVHLRRERVRLRCDLRRGPGLEVADEVLLGGHSLGRREGEHPNHHDHRCDFVADSIALYEE